MKRSIILTAVLVWLGGTSGATETKSWEQGTAEDFEKGTLKNLSLRSDGRLFLAPKSEELLDASAPALWALAEDAEGNVYAGGGGPGAGAAKLYRIEAGGQARVLAELEGLEIQAVAAGPDGFIYAATSPDGKVYKISREGKSEVFYAPGVKYLWAMAFNSKGDLFLGTGDSGEIHRVSGDGEGSVFFRTEETHVRALAVDARDNLIAGTDPGGLIVRISPAGEGFVLYQSAKQEVTAVAVAADGSIYAAGVGSKQPAAAPPAVPAAPATPAPAPTTAGLRLPAQTAATTVQAVPPAPLGGLRPQLTGGSEVYRIEADGNPRLIWSDEEAIVYSIAMDGEGRPVIGTGNQGAIYRLDSAHLFTRLQKAASSQVTALLRGRDGRIYAATANVGKVLGIGPELEATGTYESEVLDAGQFSYWGRLGVRGDEGGGRIAVEVRSGNLDRPQRNWSEWSPVALNGGVGRVGAPPARFLQYRLILASEGSERGPMIRSVDIAYLHKNVAPVIRKVEATPPNYRFPPQALSITPTTNLTLPPLAEKKRAAAKPVTAASPQSMQYAKGWIGARWLAEDDNGDELMYRVEIRGEQESEWKLVAKDLKDAYLSWDSTALPDGEYRLRVTASDSPSNPPQQALEMEFEGEPFLIDNTPPRVEGLSATRSDGKVTVRWRAADASTVIRKAEYSLDGGAWTVVEPVTRLSDSKELDYELVVEGTAGEHTIAVRVTDLFENAGLAKAVVK